MNENSTPDFTKGPTSSSNPEGPTSPPRPERPYGATGDPYAASTPGSRDGYTEAPREAYNSPRPGGSPYDQTRSQGYPPSSQMSESNWNLISHLSPVAGIVLSAGFLVFLGPLIVYLTEGKRSAVVRRHAVAALNFAISNMIYAVAGGVVTFFLALITFGILSFVPALFFVAQGIFYIVFAVLASLQAQNPNGYKYPLTLNLVK